MQQRDVTAAIESLREHQDIRRGYLKEEGWDPGRPALDLHEEDLRGLKFELDYVKHKDLNLAGTDFQGADLRGARMQGIGLREADFRGADLRGTRLHGADLRDANFEGADLRGARLRGAFLEGAHLDGALIDKQTLRGARMTSAPSWWEGVQQRVESWLSDKAAAERERVQAGELTRVEKAWDQAVVQPLERGKKWLGEQWGTVREGWEERQDARIKAGAERAYPAEEMGGDAPARGSSSPAPSPASQAGREPAERPLTYEEGRAAYHEVLERQDEIKATIAGMADPAEREQAERLLATVQQDAAARRRTPERTAELDR